MNMENKVIVITGASSGAGLAAARQIAGLGAQVVLICRDAARGQAALEGVRSASRGPEPVLLLANLEVQVEVRRLTDEIRSRFTRLDVLINNAGGIFEKRMLTADGIEKTFALNHLAPFLLTTLLLDLIQAAQQGRVITVSSESHSGKIDFNNLQGEKSYNFLAAYNLSKLGNLLFTYELARRLQGSSTTANSVSPGPTKTRFGDNMTGLPALFPRVMKSIPILFRPPDEAARTYTYAASAPELSQTSGRFFLRCREKRTAKISYDLLAAAQLWQISEKLCAASQSANGSSF
jgi:NAD(P)-dependent dehydrogenase (short-subunit alcohol dehydrogenase family)